LPMKMTIYIHKLSFIQCLLLIPDRQLWELDMYSIYVRSKQKEIIT
jgi:hypothetical protein